MNQDSGTLSFATAIDTTGFDRGIAAMGVTAKGAGTTISNALGTAPGTTAAKSFGQAYLDALKTAAKQGAEELKESITASMEQLDALRAKADEVAASLALAEGTPGAAELQAALNSVNNEIGTTEAELKAMQSAYTKATASVKEEATAQQGATTSTVSFRTQINNLRNELQGMALANQQDTEEYRKKEAQLQKLIITQNEFRKQQTFATTGATQWSGLVSGLQGAIGGYTALSGVVGVFTKDQEKLMKVQTRMQSLMSVLMGMQQLSNTLHRSSAFMLVTVRKAQELYNATLAKTKAALLSGTTAAKAFKVALAATGVGLAVVAIEALVSSLVKLARQQRAATKEQERATAVHVAGAEAYVKATTELNEYRTRLEAANLTAAKELSLLQELRSKYPSLIGQYDSKAKALAVLTAQTEAYTQAMVAQAQQEERLSLLVEKAKLRAQVESTPASKLESMETDNGTRLRGGMSLMGQMTAIFTSANSGGYTNPFEAINATNEARKQAQLDAIDADYEELQQAYTEAQAELDELLASIGDKAADEALRKEQEDATKVQEAITKTREEAFNAATEATIANLADGTAKELAEVDYSLSQRLAAIDKAEREAEKAVAEAARKGQSTTGVLSDEERGAYDTQRTAAQESATKQREKILKEQTRKQEELFREAADVFLSEEERKRVAITETYKQLRENAKKANEGGTISDDQYSGLLKLYDEGEALEISDMLIDTYGTEEQKLEKLKKEWEQRIAALPQEYKAEATRQMSKELAELSSAKFKASIGWEDIFGNLSEQSLPSLRAALSKVSGYYESNKGALGVEETKDITEAIDKLEDEIASRNPFTALHESLRDIVKAKDDLVAALEEWTAAQEALTAATDDYNAALEVEQELRARVDAGEMADDNEDYVQAAEAVAAAQTVLTEATEAANKAEHDALSARNSLTNSYTTFATNLTRVGSVVSEVGDKASALAEAFGSDLAGSIDKTISTIEEVVDAASQVIGALADTGKSVTTTIADTAESVAAGTEATAIAAASAIKTVEKASVILTIISAALQVATAIANLFNNDDELEEKIAKYQRQIDALRWELDNMNTVKLQESLGKAIDNVTEALEAAHTAATTLREEALASLSIENLIRVAYQGNTQAALEYELAIESIADAYASAAYTADKLLGEEKYDSARDQLENLAEEMILVQKQLEAEEDKKKSDSDAIADYKEELEELAQEMADVISDMMEDIIGYTAEDLASTLGDAFFEACESGEDALEAWAETAEEVVADILKQMLITEYLEDEIGEVFDKYKSEWFGDDGTFAGIDAVIASMESFASDINEIGENFATIYDALSEYVTGTIEGDSRSGTSSGIATASQESVDENNARLTTIQGHTYTLVQGLATLNETASTALDKLAGIESNTSSAATSMATVATKITTLASDVDDIVTRGVKVKT